MAPTGAKAVEAAGSNGQPPWVRWARYSSRKYWIELEIGLVALVAIIAGLVTAAALVRPSRSVLDLEPVPTGLAIPRQGPARPVASKGKGEGGKGEDRQGSGARAGGGAGGMGAGMGAGAGMGLGAGLAADTDRDPPG